MGNESSSQSTSTSTSSSKNTVTVSAPNTNIVQPRIDTTITVNPNLSNNNTINFNPTTFNAAYDNDKTKLLRIGLASVTSGAMAYLLNENFYLYAASVGGVTNGVRQIYSKKNSDAYTHSFLNAYQHFLPIAGGSALSFYGSTSHDFITLAKSIIIISTGCLTSDLI